MKISTQTSYLGEQFGDINAVKMIAEAGYDAIDYSMFYMDLKGNPLGSDDTGVLLPNSKRQPTTPVSLSTRHTLRSRLTNAATTNTTSSLSKTL